MKKRKVYLWVIIGLGFLFRLAFVLTLEDHFYFGDEPLYLLMAENFLKGKGLIIDLAHKAFRPPLFPLFTAFIHSLGGGLVAVRIANVLLSTSTVYLIYLLGKDLFTESIGFWSAAASAFWPFFIFYNGFYLTETLYLFLVLAATLYLIRTTTDPSAENIFLSGLFLGLASLCRPTMLLFVLLSLILSFFAVRKLKPVVYLALTCSLTISPWIVRNYLVLKAFIPGTTMGGRVFYEGNNLASSGGPCQVFPEEIESLPEVERDRVYYQETFRIIRIDPVRFYWLLFHKFKRFWSFIPNAAGFQTPFYRCLSLLAMVPPLPLFMVGLSFSLRRWRKTGFLITQVVYNTLFHMVFLSSIRYRLPIEPFYLILAVFGLHCLLPKGVAEAREIE